MMRRMVKTLDIFVNVNIKNNVTESDKKNVQDNQFTFNI